jgi:hypothetical protein
MMIVPTVEEISLAITDAEGPDEALLAIWKMIEPEWDNMPTVRPGDYKLPKAQSSAMWDGGIARWGENWRWQGLLLNVGPGTEGY